MCIRDRPWGSLTGIRPTKIALSMLMEGRRNVEIAQRMREEYLVSREKTALAIAIANRELHILKDIDYEEGYSLYVGIPFCPSTCLYCSFTSYPISGWEDRIEEYLRAVSYTHLDVYKRQGRLFRTGRLYRSECVYRSERIYPVSYTHLDVYKRQLKEKPTSCPSFRAATH